MLFIDTDCSRSKFLRLWKKIVASSLRVPGVPTATGTNNYRPASELNFDKFLIPVTETSGYLHAEVLTRSHFLLKSPNDVIPRTFADWLNASDDDKAGI